MIERILILTAVIITYYILRKLLFHNSNRREIVFPKNIITEDNSLPTLLYFWTEQCTQCKTIQKPIIQELKKKRNDFNLVAINAIEDKETASLFNIKTVPSIAVFSKDRKSKFINNGFITEDKLIKQLDAAYN